MYSSVGSQASPRSWTASLLRSSMHERQRRSRLWLAPESATFFVTRAGLGCTHGVLTLGAIPSRQVFKGQAWEAGHCRERARRYLLIYPPRRARLSWRGRLGVRDDG